MKKVITILTVLILMMALILTACGKKPAEQTEKPEEQPKPEETISTIEFDGLRASLPGRLQENSTLSGDNYRTFENREGNEQLESLMITSIDSVVKFGDYYTREDAARSMKELTENIDSRSDVSNPSIELGGFGDKYDLISITYKEKIGDVESYVKYAYVYFDDRTFAFTYKNKEQDLSVFDEIMKSGSYTPGSATDEKKNSDDGMQKISGGGASTTIPKEWKYSKSKSTDNAKYYIGSTFRMVYSFANTGTTVTNQKLGELTDKVLETSGEQYKGLSYYDYIVGDGIPANIVYVDKADSGIGRYERLVVFASGTNVIFIAADSEDSNFDDFETALKNIKIG